MNKNVARVLKRGGRYIAVTDLRPARHAHDHYRRRRRLLHFDDEHKTVDKPAFSSGLPSNYNVFVMTKADDLHGDDADDNEEEDGFYDKFQTTSG